MCRYIVAVWTIAAIGAPAGFGWGRQGHHVVAKVADHFLTDRARAEVRRLLEPDTGLVKVSTWADEVRPQRKETGAWHYVNIPLEAKRSAGYRQFCPQGECLPAKLSAFVATVRSDQATKEQRAEALKFIIHFVGDLHQPLHAGDRGDRGGTDLEVEYFGSAFNLHRIWDTEILSRMNSDEDVVAGMLLRELGGGRRAKWQKGSVEDWLWESHAAARTVAYRNLPKGKVPRLGQSYQKEAEKLVRAQLAKGGIRLARILNELWP